MSDTPDWDKISDQASEEADRKVGDEILGKIKMDQDKINELFPDTGDQQKFSELMEIVKSADDQNKKVNKIKDRIEDFSGTIVTLLDKVV